MLRLTVNSNYAIFNLTYFCTFSILEMRKRICVTFNASKDTFKMSLSVFFNLYVTPRIKKVEFPFVVNLFIFFPKNLSSFIIISHLLEKNFFVFSP